MREVALPSVVGLGYIVVNSTDVEKWRAFACDIFGLQCVEVSAERMLLRMDDRAYRLDIRQSDSEDVEVVGWEVASASDLDALADILQAEGFAVKRAGPDSAAERLVTDLIRLDDPDGQSIELFYGAKKDKSPFVSPTGARFSTGTNGMGHVFQLVSNEEAFRHLYIDILGFRLSDYIDFAPGAYGTFLHCNPRHHSFAYAVAPQPGVNHLMFEVEDLDSVGRAYDRVLAGGAPLSSTFGKHSNDEMLSFYVTTPSGFQLEFGTAGVVIDDETWTPARYDVASFWGHSRAAV
jgi:3,4-dihydroxy-9,10-secoandrosta-1,3,5(10)-triene-9,17-dione 4,5-dioxygenase